MTDLIFHHFDSSPFSEKVRLVLGWKHLAWRSVSVPLMLPKPDVVALTGGYRRTPLLQIGADVYCDTALICRVLDASAPEPPLYPAGVPLHAVVAQWADTTLFWTAIPYATQPAGIPHLFPRATLELLQALARDRAAMTAGFRRLPPRDAAAQLVGYLGWLEAILAPGQAFLLGAQPGLADFAVAPSLWFVRLAPPLAEVLAPFSALAAWYERIAGFGHGAPAPLTSGEAIEIAAAAGGHAACAVEPDLGFSPGEPVTVAATDYATDPVPGALIGLTRDEVVLERRDARAGTVHVHFPRVGYQIKRPT
jgi:glutathione S-transferase